MKGSTIYYVIFFIAVLGLNYWYHQSTNVSAPITIKEGDYSEFGVEDKTPLVIYTASWCKVCAQLKEELSKRQLNYREYDINADTNSKELLAKHGIRSIPVIFYKNRMTEGFDTEMLDNLLKL